MPSGGEDPGDDDRDAEPSGSIDPDREDGRSTGPSGGNGDDSVPEDGNPPERGDFGERDATDREDPPSTRESDPVVDFEGDPEEGGPEADPIRHDEERTDEGIVEWLRWIRHTDHPGVTFLREFLGSMLAVLFIGMLLFAISGVWPPMVAVKSDSMEPHMYRGDLIFVMEEHRLTPPEAVDGTGVVTYRAGKDTGYKRFGSYGDVIIYRPDGTDGIPVIHRARFWVEDGENWYGEAAPAHRGNADSCEEMPNCPAPHAGFITKGDNNRRYDQVTSISTVVKPEWVKGTAEVRVPWLGYVRLQLSALQPPVDGFGVASAGRRNSTAG